MVNDYKIDDFQLLNFTSLFKEDLKQVLQWRNHELIRESMHSSEVITEIDHFKFIETLQYTETKRYWLVQKSGVNVGVVYLIFDDTKTPTLGMYVVPDMLGKGIGSWMLQHFLDFIFTSLKLDAIRLEVYESNTPAIRLYKKFGFKEISVDSSNEKGPLITMEKHL